MKSLLVVLSIISLSGCTVVPTYGTYPEYGYSTPTYVGPTMTIVPPPIVINPWYGGYKGGYYGGYNHGYRGGYYGGYRGRYR